MEWAIPPIRISENERGHFPKEVVQVCASAFQDYLVVVAGRLLFECLFTLLFLLIAKTDMKLHEVTWSYPSTHLITVVRNDLSGR